MQKQLTAELLERFYALLPGLPKIQGGLAHRGWVKHGGLPIEDEHLGPRREWLLFTLRRLTAYGADVAGVHEDLAVLKHRVLMWYIRGGTEDPRLPPQPDLWRDVYEQRDKVVAFLRKELPTLRTNFLVGDIDPAGLDATATEEVRSRSWVGTFERWLREDPRAKMQPPVALRTPLRRKRGTPKLAILTEGRRMLGRRGVQHGDREALLMAVGLIPYRK